jgi:hypothetical protein
MGVQGQDLRDLLPFMQNFIAIDLSLFPELVVAEPIQFFRFPKADQVRLIHHIDVRPPERFLRSFEILREQENGKRKLILVGMLLEKVRIFLNYFLNPLGLPHSRH